IRNGFEKFNEKIIKIKKEDISYIVCDADEESDLELASYYMAKVSNNILWAGSAGLAEVLPDVLRISEENTKQPDFNSNQVLAISGSLSSVTREQIKYTMTKEGIRGLEIDAVKVFDKTWDEYSRSIVKKGGEILSSSIDLIIYLPSNEKVREETVRRGRAEGFDEKQIS